MPKYPIGGYMGRILEIDLTSGKSFIQNFIQLTARSFSRSFINCFLYVDFRHIHFSSFVHG